MTAILAIIFQLAGLLTLTLTIGVWATVGVFVFVWGYGIQQMWEKRVK
jgi:hypothetical protein